MTSDHSDPCENVFPNTLQQWNVTVEPIISQLLVELKLFVLFVFGELGGVAIRNARFWVH